MLSASISPHTEGLPRWRALFNLTVLGACLYTVAEWLFFMSRPSSLSVLAFLDSARIGLSAAGTIVLISSAILFVLSLPSFILKNSDWQSRPLAIGAIIPALLLSMAALTVLNNFTSVELDFEIGSAHGFLRGMYALGFGLFFLLMLLFARRAVWASSNSISWLTLVLLAVTMAALLATRLARYPNIIILGGDGLSASYLTPYNAQMKTTPFLSELSPRSLLAENAFPNAGSTTGSTTSVLTGKETLETNVYRYSDILSGRDTLEHLPGILRQHGYETVEIGTPDYVDARKIDLLEGFDIVNNQSLAEPASAAMSSFLGSSLSTPFLQTIEERARERILHILFIKEMQIAPVDADSAALPTVELSDEQRVDQIIDLLDHADRPLLIFTHLMDTHGPYFSFEKQVFSGESSAKQEWDERRYQDALLSFDGHVKRIFERLAETGKLNQTILVVYTDHGLRYAVHERLPLIIHFPEDASAGTRKNNVQNIDIPPTLLDYLGIPIPDWMNGLSLLDGETPPDRAILTTTAGSPNEIAPPFQQINIVQVIVCHKWYALNVRKNTFETGEIHDHTARCRPDLLPSSKQARQGILEQLHKSGYDISSLQ